MNPADPHMQRPCHSPFFVLITPCGNEIRFDQLERIVPRAGAVTLRCRPRIKVAQQVVEVPRMGHVERW